MREHLGISHTAKPVIPSYVAVVYKYGLVVAVVADVFEEDAATEERDLEGLDVDVGAVCAPCVGSDGVGHEGGKQAIEVE